MRENVKAFVAHAAQAFHLEGPVYEFGSYLVEGQGTFADLRPCFAGHQFVGCDLRPGPGVDRIEDLAQLTLPSNSVGTIVCVDTLEHVFHVEKAVSEMIRVLAPGGAIVVSVPMDFRIHDYPSDYWRLTPSCLARLLSPLDSVLVGSQGVESYPHTVFAIGMKSPVPAHFAPAAGEFIEGFQNWLHTAQESVPRWRRFRQRMLGWTRGKGERRRMNEYFQARFVFDVPPQSSPWKMLASGHFNRSGVSRLG